MATWATINSVNLEPPNSLRESNQVLGADTVTLLGHTRRSIRALKRIWVLSYSHLSAAKYDEIYSLFSAGNTVSLTIIDSSYVDVQSIDVFVDLEARDFVAGNPHYLANVTITLTEQ